MKYLIQMEDIPQGWEVKYFEDGVEYSQIYSNIRMYSNIRLFAQECFGLFYEIRRHDFLQALEGVIAL